MIFGEAFKLMVRGAKVRRAGWNGAGQYVAIQFPDEGNANTLPYCWLKNAQGHRVPWLPSQGDLFASDWEECDE